MIYLTVDEVGDNVIVTIDNDHLDRARELLSNEGIKTSHSKVITFKGSPKPLADLVVFKPLATDKDSTLRALEELVALLPQNFDKLTDEIRKLFVHKEVSDEP